MHYELRGVYRRGYGLACGLFIAFPLPIAKHYTERIQPVRSPSCWESGVGRKVKSQKLKVKIASPSAPPAPPVSKATLHSPHFLVVGGGGAPSYNEIALEKNVLYFQRTLRVMGYDPEQVASVFFANGNDGKATIRYLDRHDNERYKAPEIPFLKGAATLSNLQHYFQQTAKQSDRNSLFFYFTGHGGKNTADLNNNSLYLWQEQPLSVKQLTQMLDRMPPQTPVVAMMAQCFSGSFANFIYQGGDPHHPVALQTRCGFFATVSTQPSVGCTPEVNEADYRDYSSSFFAGLSGRDRLGRTVASADYNRDGRVSYAEAHAFAKVDEKSIDLPLSTSEAWLQSQRSRSQLESILSVPIAQILRTARPEQRYVVNSLSKKFGFNLQKSYAQNSTERKEQSKFDSEEQTAYRTRLAMELSNIAIENQIRTSHNPTVATLDRLIKCESGSWSRL